jgi:hypothetical protein
MNVLAPGGRQRAPAAEVRRRRSRSSASGWRVPGDRPRDAQARHARPRGRRDLPVADAGRGAEPRQRVAQARGGPRQPGGGAQRGDRQALARRAWADRVRHRHAPAASGVALLRDAGVKRFVFTSDHGFLLLDDTMRARRSRTAARSTRSAGTCSRAWLADHTGRVRVALATSATTA